MNKVELIGRLTRDPEVRYSTTKNGEQMCIARYTLAIDRKGKDAGADFISCVAFGKNGEFTEKYLKQGLKIAVSGRIQTGSYTNKDGKKVYTTDIVVEEQEFCESKREDSVPQIPQDASAEGFISIPDGIENDLPFK
jgi:single-strand DNA-binding protein